MVAGVYGELIISRMYTKQKKIGKTIGETPNMGNCYAHSLAISKDNKTLFVFEENNSFDMAAFDISTDAKVKNPELLSRFQYSGDKNKNAIVHNGFVKENYLYVAYYRAGFRIFDISNVDKITEVGKDDTFVDPDGDGNPNNSISNKFDGAWNVYVYLPSKKVLVSDCKYGLFVLDIDDSPPPPKACSDDTTWRDKKKNKNCAFVQKKPSNTKCNKWKDSKGKKAKKACPIACSNFDSCVKPNCRSDWEPKNEKDDFKSCSDLQTLSSAKKLKKYCGQVGTDKTFAYEACQKCGKCQKSQYF